ncbi:MAG: TfuA-related McrA-glycine thioamidation protein [Acidobacteria bacterium]|nr:MAG: TfuA-related McrA-glycine thioamidation protein [Acidobacteriota bacterium]
MVYLGPSLSHAEAAGLLEADYRPPIKRGDLPSHYEGTVVIIDGEFGQSLSVSPNEILSLLDRGTTVIGASSMGALRAAELYPFGMKGYGWIYEQYRSGRIIADDEVAIAYSPLDLRPVTVPLVNVRYWLGELEAAGHLEAKVSRRMLASLRRVFYADRTDQRVRLELEKIVGADELRRLYNISGGGITDVKAADARQVLMHLARNGAG